MVTVKRAVGTGTTSVSVNLPPPPGAGGGAGPQNIKIWSIHASDVAGGTGGNHILTFQYTTLAGATNTTAFTITRASVAGDAGKHMEFTCEFPVGWVFPIGNGTQFLVSLSAPATTTQASVNVTYEYTNEGG